MKSSRPRSTRPPAVWQQLVASGCLGLVLALNLLSAAPELHSWLHEVPVVAGDESHGDCEHGDSKAPAPHADDAACVITQFANGQVGAEAALTVVVSATLREIAILPDRTAPFSGRSHVLLPPGCGPPQV
jgi:hypothetical protein